MKLKIALVLCLFLQVQISRVSAQATGHAASGRWFVKSSDSDSSSVWFGTLGWASTSKINWTLPIFSAGGNSVSTGAVPFSENKFDTSSSLPTARSWIGYASTGFGPSSTVFSSGKGSSSVGLVFYGADWTVTASGTGTYEAKAVADDPWNVYPSDLSSLTGATYSLYIPFSMLGGQSEGFSNSGGSSLSFDVTYATASGATTLLNAVFTGSQVTINTTSDFGANLRFYQELDETVTPTGALTPGVELSSAGLNSLVSGNLNSNGTLSSTHLGIVLSGIPIPTTVMSDGSVAQVGVSSTAYAMGIIPEPNTLALLSLGMLGFALRRRK